MCHLSSLEVASATARSFVRRRCAPSDSQLFGSFCSFLIRLGFFNAAMIMAAPSPEDVDPERFSGEDPDCSEEEADNLS